MVAEYERRFSVRERPGAVRLLAYLNRAHMGSYQAALDNPARPADIEATRAYRHKYGFGLNIEQEVAKNIGIFSRVGPPVVNHPAFNRDRGPVSIFGGRVHWEF